MRICKLLAALFFILVAFEAAYACSCARSGPPCNYYGSTSVIFLGRVVGAAQQRTITDKDGQKTTFDVGTIRFLVQENYKGASGYEVEINSGTGGGDCGYWFLRNESYVVYAYRSTEDNKLYTNICTRTAHVTDAKEDLEYLRGLATAKPGATLSGKLRRIMGDPEHGPYEDGPKMAGVKITVSGEGRTFETRTNDDGEYRLTGLPPGNYDAFPELPSNLGAVSNRDERDDFGRFIGRRPVNLTERGCGELSFTVRFSGVVSGKVIKSDGEPAREVQINLQAEDNEDRYWFTWTDKEGRYEFPMVQPGSYLLGFNLRWAPDNDDPYAKTFYPGVKTRSEASLITVGEGERLKGYDLTLPPRLSHRLLLVSVVWPDGSPAVGVTVRYEANEATSLGETTKTNGKGVAEINLFENYYYIISASAERGDKNIYGAPVEVLVDKKLKPLKFVLNKEGYAYEESDKLKRKSPK